MTNKPLLILITIAIVNCLKIGLDTNLNSNFLMSSDKEDIKELKCPKETFYGNGKKDSFSWDKTYGKWYMLAKTKSWFFMSNKCVAMSFNKPLTESDTFLSVKVTQKSNDDQNQEFNFKVYLNENNFTFKSDLTIPEIKGATCVIPLIEYEDSKSSPAYHIYYICQEGIMYVGIFSRSTSLPDKIWEKLYKFTLDKLKVKKSEFELVDNDENNCNTYGASEGAKVVIS
jgi:hypothetical protein